MLQFIDVYHSFGPQIVFEGFSWHIKPNRKIALVGPNGAGKTTLFQFATGALKPEKGEVSRGKNTTISLFQQIPDFDPKKNVLETVLISNYNYNSYIIKKHELDKKFDTVSHDSLEFEEILHEQAELEDFAHAHDLHKLEIKVRQTLSGLGFTDAAMLKEVGSYSPGYKHRIALAAALLNPHNLLLLDEPTNHLDDASKTWLSNYLQSVTTTFVLVTHDPEFLAETTDTVAEISKNGVTEFRGTLLEYLEEKNEIHEKMKARYEKEEAYLAKRTDWINRFRAKASKSRQVQSAIKKLEKRDKLESPEESFWNKTPDYEFNFVDDGKISFRLEDASFRYGKNDRVIFTKANMEISSGEKVAIVGPNGAGKSTLMRSIKGLHKLSEGNIYFGPKTKLGYFSQNHHDELDGNLNLIQTILKKYPDIAEEKARTMLGHFSFSGDNVYKSVGTLSGGEQSRLRLTLLSLEEVNCILLDEPTNHLDMVTRDALKRALSAFPGAVVIISHDPDFLKGLCNRTFELSGGKLKDLNCSFDDYIKFHKEGVYAEEPQVVEVKRTDTRTAVKADKARVKKMRKDLEEAEKRISLLEINKKNLEELLVDPSFYKNRSYQTELDNYNATKKELSELFEKWENLSAELDGVE